jgi:hypothetical protein
MDNQEKIFKINAELARLELEMELDHGGSFGKSNYLGPKEDGMFSSITKYFRRSGKTVKNTETDAQSLTFQNTILTQISERLGIVFTKEAMLNQSWMDQFADKGGGVAFDAVHVWNADYHTRRFNVIFRASAKGRPEYSLVSMIKAGKKNFADLLFTSSYVASPSDIVSVMDNFADRIAQCIVTREDLPSIGQAATSASGAPSTAAKPRT